MTNSGVTSTGVHNSRVNNVHKEEEGDLISIEREEDSDCADMEDLNLSKTDEGGVGYTNGLYSAASLTNNQRRYH